MAARAPPSRRVERLTADVGLSTRTAQVNRDAESAVHDSDLAARDAVSGVNLDEEAANMLRYQQAYAAAAQIIAVAERDVRHAHERGEEIAHAHFHRRHASHQHRRHPRAADAHGAHAGSRSPPGKRFQTASEDPIAAARAAVLDRAMAENEQFGRNSNIVEARLNYEEQSLADVTSLLQYVRERALQGANSTLGADERRMLANDVRLQMSALMEMANRDDGNGEYLFAGTSTGAAPFARGTTGVNYLGDMTNRVVRVSNSQAIADGHSGADVFMNISERNGVFRTDVTPTNTGSGTIDVGRVVNSTAWVPDNYSLQFTSPTDWQVVDDTLPTPVVIASGTGFRQRAEHFIPRRDA